MKDNKRVYGAQIQGDRDYQEDAFTIVDLENGSRLLVLCDGMGGHAGGAQASNIASKTFVDIFLSGQTGIALTSRLDVALRAANEALNTAAQDNPELGNMGTTLTAVHLNGNELHWISVGDSPLFLLRKQEISRLNANHSLAAVFDEMVKTGHMTAEEAATDPKRHSLRSSLSGDDIQLIDSPEQPFYLEEGDYLLLASDGLETLSPDEMLDLASGTEPEGAVKALLAKVDSSEKTDQDNTTVICYRNTSPAVVGHLKQNILLSIAALFVLGVLAYQLVSKSCSDCQPEENATEIPASVVPEIIGATDGLEVSEDLDVEPLSPSLSPSPSLPLSPSPQETMNAGGINENGNENESKPTLEANETFEPKIKPVEQSTEQPIAQPTEQVIESPMEDLSILDNPLRADAENRQRPDPVTDEEKKLTTGK